MSDRLGSSAPSPVTPMNKTLRNLALFGGMAVLLSFVVFVVNQTAQVVQLASTFDPAAGRVVLFGLVGVYAVLVAVPLGVIAAWKHAPRRGWRRRANAAAQTRATARRFGMRSFLQLSLFFFIGCRARRLATAGASNLITSPTVFPAVSKCLRRAEGWRAALPSASRGA